MAITVSVSGSDPVDGLIGTGNTDDVGKIIDRYELFKGTVC